MAIRLSTALRNYLVSGGCFQNAFKGGRLLIYSGTQPTLADNAVTGTLLVTITDASGAWTAETGATGTVELTGGASGNVSSITVGGFEILGATITYASSLANTAALIAAQINKFIGAIQGIRAAVLSGSTITIYAPQGSGTAFNAAGCKTVVTTAATITKTDTDMASGVAAVNGLKFGDETAGVLAKDTSQTWSGVAGESGTAGWFRLVGNRTDAGAIDSAAALFRLDGNISTSGANLNMASTAIVSGSTITIDSFNVTMPAS